jgi:hypothetical protein
MAFSPLGTAWIASGAIFMPSPDGLDPFNFNIWRGRVAFTTPSGVKKSGFIRSDTDRRPRQLPVR